MRALPGGAAPNLDSVQEVACLSQFHGWLRILNMRVQSGIIEQRTELQSTLVYREGGTIAAAMVSIEIITIVYVMLNNT